MTVASGSLIATFLAHTSGTTVEDCWVTASLNGSSAQTMVTVNALQIQGSPSEISGWSNGATVTPFVQPAGFAGQLVTTGSGQATFARASSTDGVSFLNCCANTNNAYYSFKGVQLGSLFNLNSGQISFSLKSSYSFAQRQTTASASRYVFDVEDNPAAMHRLFYFQTEYTQNYLVFSWAVAGVGQFYYVPHGTEDTLFGSGVMLQVTLTWSNGVTNLYLNGLLAKSVAFTPLTAAWTANSTFDFGALNYLTFGGYNSCDDTISDFTIGVPIN